MWKKEFWDSFYAKKHNKRNKFEWLIDYKEFVDTIDINVIGAMTLLLDIGCGTSTFSRELQASLSRPCMLVCADFSHQALSSLMHQHQQHLDSTYVDYVQCNGRNLPFRNNLFDLGVDKGYVDSLLKGPTQDDANKSIASVMEKINERGVLFQITDEPPELRQSLLDKHFNLTSSFKQIELENSIYFLYIINKKWIQLSFFVYDDGFKNGYYLPLWRKEVPNNGLNETQKKRENTKLSHEFRLF